MKKLLFGILLICSQVYSQEETVLDTVIYECKYLLTFQPDSTDIDSKMTEETILWLGKKISKFQSLDVKLKDTDKRVLRVDDNVYSTRSCNIKKKHFKNEIFKNYPSGKISTFEGILKDNFIYQEPMQLFEWKIEGDKKMIEGYECKKATTDFAGRHYTVWYTEEIPISDGPYKFNGLPGLIMEISDSKNHYNFQLIGLQKATDKLITIKSKNITVTRKEFEKVKSDYKADPLGKLNQLGITLDIDKSLEKELFKNGKKLNNNTIEIL